MNTPKQAKKYTVEMIQNMGFEMWAVMSEGKEIKKFWDKTFANAHMAKLIWEQKQ